MASRIFSSEPEQKLDQKDPLKPLRKSCELYLILARPINESFREPKRAQQQHARLVTTIYENRQAHAFFHPAAQRLSSTMRCS
jgi:hypothetical protein